MAKKRKKKASNTSQTENKNYGKYYSRFGNSLTRYPRENEKHSSSGESKGSLKSRYNSVKAEYKRLGTQLFKANHGGKTIREYNASKRRKKKAKHRKKR